MSDQKFEQYAIVELFGHNQIAGLVTEQSIGGSSFVRVDVPEIDGMPGFTKLYGQGAIYAMTPVDKETATAAAKAYHSRPIELWSAQQLLSETKKLKNDDNFDGSDELPY